SMESDRRIGDRGAFVVFRSTEIWKWSAGGRPEAYWPPEDHVRHALHDEVPVSVPFPDLARNAMEVPAGATASQVMLGNSEARTSSPTTSQRPDSHSPGSGTMRVAFRRSG